MKIVKTRSEVRNISRKTPWVIETPVPKVVETLSSPGNMPDTTAAAAMPPSIWARKQRAARRGVRAWIRRRPSVTYINTRRISIFAFQSPNPHFSSHLHCLTLTSSLHNSSRPTKPLLNRHRMERERTYSRIKQPPANPKKHPHAHHQTKPKYQTDIQQHTRIRRLRYPIIPIVLPRCRRVAEHRRRVGDLRAPEREEEEHECPAELGEGGDELFAPFGGDVC